MGAVYQAIDTRIANRRVAIKEMSQAHLDHSNLAQATAHFQREANMLASLQHTNLPHVYDAFNEQGRSYLVMDFIVGKTLTQLLREAGGQPLPIATVVGYAIQLCDVLAYLHQQRPQIIFRDLKPSNVMVTESGHVFLIDFGIARFFKEGQQQDTIFLGSPGYAPPEQHGTSQTSPRSDLYSLGVTLHYCLTGRDPYLAQYRFAFPSVRQMNQQVLIELDQLISRLVAIDEQQRPASAAEVQQTLLRISGQAAEHTSALPPAFPPTQYIIPSPMTPALNNNNQAQAPTIAVGSRPAPLPTPGQMAQPVSPPRFSSVSGSASIWTMPFSLLFGILPIVTIGSSLYAFTFIDFSDHIVEFGLSLLLLIITIVASTLVRGIIPRIALFFMALGALLASLAFSLQALPGGGLQALTSNIPQDVRPNLLFTVGIAAISIVLCFWLTRPAFRWVERILLLTVSVVVFVVLYVQYPSADSDVSKHIYLLVALIVLSQGVLVATQGEKVYRKTSAI
jgi:serine/threonine protein kinase